MSDWMKEFPEANGDQFQGGGLRSDEKPPKEDEAAEGSAPGQDPAQQD